MTGTPATSAAITELPAHRIAAAVRAGSLSARACVDAFLGRIDSQNPGLRAIVARCDERARAEALAIDARVARGEPLGALCGVPMTIKDMHATEGVRTSYGLPWFHGHVPRDDSAAVARLRAADAIVIGKSSVPFAGYDWQCRHPTHGVARNPHDPSRTCGGSSGGAAAALAADLCALELGSDLAGSIRVPAHFCGVFGLKPGDGAVPLAGHGPPGARVETMCSIGPLARDLADLRLAFDVIAEPGAGGRADLRSARPLRIAWATSCGGVTADRATRAVMAALAARLAADGATVVEALPPDWSATTPLEIWGGVDGFEFRASWPPPFRWPLVRALFLGGIAGATIGPSALSRALARGMAGGRRRFVEHLERRAAFAAASDAWLANHDALIVPCAATPAFTHRRLPRAIDVDGSPVRYSLAQSAFCCPVNVAGACSVAAPAGRSPDGLPIGLQWIAGRGRERELLATVAAALVTPTIERPTPDQNSQSRSTWAALPSRTKPSS